MARKKGFQQQKSQWKKQKQTGHDWNHKLNVFNNNKSIETRQNFHNWSDKCVLKASLWFEIRQRPENRLRLRRRIRFWLENTSSLAIDFALHLKSFYRVMSSFLVMAQPFHLILDDYAGSDWKFSQKNVVHFHRFWHFNSQHFLRSFLPSYG